MVRAVKNRFGPVDEVGCFDLSDDGIVAVTDPTGLFCPGTTAAVPGTCVAVTLEGRRPLLAEVQALVTRPPPSDPAPDDGGLDAVPRRDGPRGAAAARRIGSASSSDVFASTVGGVRLTEPAADLAVALAIASASTARALPTRRGRDRRDRPGR